MKRNMCRAVVLGAAIYFATLPLSVTFDSRGFEGWLLHDWTSRVLALLVAALAGPYRPVATHHELILVVDGQLSMQTIEDDGGTRGRPGYAAPGPPWRSSTSAPSARWSP